MVIPKRVIALLLEPFCFCMFSFSMALNDWNYHEVYYHSMTKTDYEPNKQEIYHIYRVLKRRCDNFNNIQLSFLEKEAKRMVVYSRLYHAEVLKLNKHGKRGREIYEDIINNELHTLDVRGQIRVLLNYADEIYYFDVKKKVQLTNQLERYLFYPLLAPQERFDIHVQSCFKYILMNQYELALLSADNAKDYLDYVSIREKIVFNTTIAHIDYRAERIDNVKDLIHENEAYFENLEKPFILGKILQLQLLGDYYFDKSVANLDSFRVVSEQALELALGYENNNLKMSAYRYMSWYYLYTGDIEKALDNTYLAASYSTDYHEAYAFIDTLLVVNLLLHEDRFDDLELLIPRIEAFSNTKKTAFNIQFFPLIFTILREYYEKKGDLVQALKLADKAAQADREHINSYNNSRDKELRAIHNISKKELELSNANAQNELLTIDLERKKAANQRLIAFTILAVGISLTISFLMRKIRKQNKALDLNIKVVSQQKLVLETRETELNEALQIKSLLFEELHHRIKNNLQLISTTIRMYLKNNKTLTVEEFGELLDSRIRVLGLSYKRLGFEKEALMIDSKDYLEDLCRELMLVMNTSEHPVELNMKIAPFKQNMNDAILLGMIVNECVVNVFKHAFPDKTKTDKRLYIQTQSQNNTLSKIIIGDNGIGMPSDVKSNLGLKIIDALSARLNGKVQYSSGASNGSELSIEFKHDWN